MKRTLLHSSLAQSTHKAYDKFLDRFSVFFEKQYKQSFTLPATPEAVTDFIAYLHMQSLAPSTIASHLSAITHIHLLAGYSDPCANYTARKMLTGCKKINRHIDSRRPLLLHHISLLCSATIHLYMHSPFYRKLYTAVILTTFHGFFRIGELLPTVIARDAKSVVQINHVSFTKHSVQIQLLHHKTQKSSKPTVIVLSSQQANCPVRALREYIKLRGLASGPLFLSPMNEPLSVPSFRSVFNTLLNFAKLSPLHYKLHSFRIGACTQAIISGTPEQEVMRMGRWRSNAFKRYIRTPKVKLSRINRDK